MPVSLLIDADDTLWENNIYFEQAFAEFVGFLDHSTLSAAGVRAALDEIEAVNSRLHGYGSLTFAHNLRECYLRLAEREIRPEDLDKILAWGERLLRHPMELIEGVEETLRYLRERHRLVLFTKGHPDEQRLKLDRSGLGPLFHRTAIVKEKNAEAYRSLIRDLAVPPAAAWMVGNSPRSDINPALEAGLNAVYIPHAHTWTLEREPVRPANGRLLTLACFQQLREHF